jgi:hypothetical protein
VIPAALSAFHRGRILNAVTGGLVSAHSARSRPDWRTSARHPVLPFMLNRARVRCGAKPEAADSNMGFCSAPILAVRRGAIKPPVSTEHRDRSHLKGNRSLASSWLHRIL